MKWGLKGVISIDADSGPPRYVLWCCGGICHQPDTFDKIGCGHTVKEVLFFELLQSGSCKIRFQNLKTAIDTKHLTWNWLTWLYPTIYQLNTFIIHVICNKLRYSTSHGPLPWTVPLEWNYENLQIFENPFITNKSVGL